MSVKLMCQNCGHTHGPRDECVMGVLAQALRERIGEDIDIAFLGFVDADSYWTRFLEPGVDALQRDYEGFKANILPKLETEL